MRLQELAALGGLVVFCGLVATHAQEQEPMPTPDVLKFKMKSLDGKEVDLAKYKGKVVMFVNVASQCGYTPQYKGLQALHAKYSKQGLVVVGVPCNQFGGQEPGTAEEIKTFCQANYGVEFDMLGKVDVNGEGQCELFKHLTSKETAGEHAGKVKWNFEKFLVGRDGKIVGRYRSNVAPESATLTKAIEEALAKQS